MKSETKTTEFLEMQVKHLSNELELTRGEYERKANDYFEIYSRMEKMVEERTQSLEEEIVRRKAAERDLKKANRQLHDFNRDLEQRVVERTRALREAKQQAESANQTKSEILANVSHELRTPMNAILGFTDIISRRSDDPQIHEYLDSIETSAQNLLTLINDILDLSKIEAGKMDLNYEKTDLVSVLDDIQQFFSWTIRDKKLDFIIEVDPKLPKWVLIDEVRIRQILINLIGNAVKFTDQGYVKVSVSVSRQRTKKPRGKKKALITLKLGVEDTGVGIPELEQKHIFNAFQQRQGQSFSKYGGTGLGLAVTKRLVDMMNGYIKLKSSPEKGSLFLVTIRNLQAGSTALDAVSGLKKRKRDARVARRSPQHKTNSRRQTKQHDLTLDADNMAELQQALFLLEGELMEEWRNLHNQFVFSRIADFGESVRELSGSRGIGFVDDWAEKLLKEVQYYDVDRIPATMKQFPEIVDRLRQAIQGADPHQIERENDQ